MTFSVPSISLIPPVYKLAAVITIIVVLISGAYFKGRADVAAKWEIEKAKTALQIEELKGKQKEVTIKEVIVYRDRIKVVKEKGKTVTEYIDRVITVVDENACHITPAMIEAHKRAATPVDPK